MAEVKSSTITLDDKTALDPGFLLQQCQRLELDVSWYGKANSYVLPRGKRPGIGYVLLLNEDYTALTANYATTRTLKFTFGAETITLANQLIVGGTPIAQGSEITDQTAILVKVADTARWTSSRIAPGISLGANATFNMPYPHDPENNINVGTSDNAATYTDVAEGLAADAGFDASVSSAAEFPSTGTPLHWSTADRSAWDALHQFLSMYGYTTLVSRGGARSIIPLGEDDAVAEGTLETYSSQRTRGGLGQDRTEARIPAKLSIIVPGYDYQYDDESVGLLVCPSDYHYVHHAYHIKDVLASAALAGVQAYGTTEQLPVWGDRVANFTNDARDTDPKNLVDLGTYADDLGQQLYNVLYYSMRPRDELYWGLIPIDPGPDIEAVAWFDLGDGKGMQTRIYQNLSHDTHPQGLTSTESQIPHWTDPLPRSVGERENFPISGRYSGPTFTPLIAQIEDTSGAEATKISVSKDGTAGTYRKFDGQIGAGGAFTWNSDTVSPTSTLKHRDMTGIPFGTLLAPTYEVNRVLSLKNFQTNEWNHLPIQRHVYLGVVTQSGGIAARSGNTMTAGTVDIYKSVAGTWTSVAAATATVYNGLSKVAAQNSKVLIIKELLGASAEFVIVNDFDAEANFWEFTLNEGMGGGTAAADKITIGGADTGVDIEVADPAGLFTRALDGAKGVCVEIEGSYYVLECQSKAGWIEFTLTANLGSSASCSQQGFGGTQQDVQDPTATTVHDPQGLFEAAVTGCKGRAIYDAIDDQYNVVECQTIAGWIRFVLTADMSGGSAACTVAETDFGGSQNDVYDPGRTTTVYDADGNFPLALDGAVGQAVYDSIDNKYYIVSCDQQALRLQALVDESSGVATGDADFQVDTLVVASPRPFSMLPPTYVDATTELTVLNRYEFKLDNNAEVDIYYTGGAWVCVQGTCPA